MNGRMRRWAVALVSLGLAGGATVGLGAGPASAGETCWTPGYCSRTHNDANDWAEVAKNWCGNAEWMYTNNTPCPTNTTDILDPGESTSIFEDWDTFRIDAGCYFAWYVINYDVPVPSVTYWTWDLRGYGTHGWFRVHDNQGAHLTNIVCYYPPEGLAGKRAVKPGARHGAPVQGKTVPLAELRAAGRVA